MPFTASSSAGVVGTTVPASVVSGSGGGSGGSSGPINTPIPGVDQYAAADVLANNAYNNALATLNQNRLNTLTSYGYTGAVDPTSGVISGVHVDPNAVYGQLQQLLHGQAIEDQQASYGAQDRGLFGGLANQAGSQLHYAHGAQDTQLGQTLESDLANYQLQQQQAAETRDNTLWSDEQAAADAAIQGQGDQTIDQLISSLGDGQTAPQPKAAPAPKAPTPKARAPKAPTPKARVARTRAFRRIINRHTRTGRQ